MKNKILILCLLLFSLNLYSQDRNELSEEIHQNISNMKEYVNNLKYSLSKLEYINEEQSFEIESLKKDKELLSKNMDDTITKIETVNNDLIIFKSKLNTASKIIIVLFIIFAIKIILNVVIMILKIKCNIVLPYWLNCII